MKKQMRIRTAALLLTLILSAGAVYTAPAVNADEPETRYIVKIKESFDFRRKDQSVPFDVVGEADMVRLRDAGLLVWYEPDGVIELPDEPTAACYTDDKWDLAMIRADEAFAINAVGQGVRVGVVDSGVNAHPALAECLMQGESFVEGADALDTSDYYGHGTLVAGLIAGKDENGCLGAAPGVELVPLKITDGKIVAVSTVCKAIYSGIDDYGCDVLNLSLGIRSDYQALREAVEYAEQQGVIIVSAVGNNGNASLYFPACYETVIGVGAVDETGTVYYHSNQNDSVFLTAPGANVKTAGRTAGYTTASGTSFAVPSVTAAVAVLRGLDHDLTPQAIRELLSQTATDKGAEGWDKCYGWGIVNIGGSVLALTTEPPDPGDCPRDDTCPMSAFTDLDMNAWYHDGVHWALTEGVMAGTGADSFSPNTATTRAMLVTILWRMEGAREPESTETAFTDLKEDAWYRKAVLWAFQEGLTAGTSETTFSPDDPLTREQLAVFLRRYAEYREADVSASADLSGYTDADSVSDYALRAVKWAVAVSLITGTSQTTLSPKDSATRAQIATVLWRLRTNMIPQTVQVH